MLSLRRMLAKSGKRNDKLCLLQNNSLLLSRFSYRVRVTPQKKKKKKKREKIGEIKKKKSFDSLIFLQCLQGKSSLYKI